LNALYLIDVAVTETNAVKLRFVDASGKIEEFIDEKYKSSFLTSYPLNNQDKQTVDYLSGDIQIIEKADLFTGERRTLARVSWPSVKIALKAAERFSRRWESEIDFTKSYVYDKGLAFGAPHSEDSLKPILDISTHIREELEETFKEVRPSDPLKYAQITYWSNLLNQPIPNLAPDFFGVEEADPEKVYAAWMLSRIANLPLTEAFNSHRVSDWLKSIMYTYLRRNEFLIPTAEELTKGKPTHTVTGALTVAPKPGIYFDTVVCDFESLYPSCIDSFNLSYETVDCGHPECMSNRIPDFEGYVCTKRRGFYAVLIGALKELRIRLFKPASKDNALADEEKRRASAATKLLKLILVSSYGVTVRIHGLACPPLAESITGYGRYALKESWRMAEEKGLRPLYGDTDSLFLDNASDEQIEWLIRTVKERFNLDLAVDKKYRLCVLPKAKKAYFGILKDGTPDIKGVTAAKSNSPRYINNVFQQCVKELSGARNQEEYEHAKERIKEVVRKAIVDLRNRKVELADLAYSVRLYFDPGEKIADMKTAAQPYQCALQLIEAGKKLRRGDTVAFVKVKPFKHKDKTFTVKPIEFTRSLWEINVEDYVRNLLTALNQSFEPMGVKIQIEKEAEISRWLRG
jgi:DNA polymerase elongation subunit (family B)